MKQFIHSYLVCVDDYKLSSLAVLKVWFGGWSSDFNVTRWTEDSRLCQVDRRLVNYARYTGEKLTM